MGSQENYEAIPIGMDLGTFEMTLDEETVKDRKELVQWQSKGLAGKDFLPPGITISQHARMNFAALPEMKVSIWAKSEHEFLKPMKLPLNKGTNSRDASSKRFGLGTRMLWQ